MYNTFFHFSELPFSISPDPHFMYMSVRHQEGLAHLLYGINHSGGFIALTGEVGTGKTMLCHCLLQQLPENIDIALILNPKMNAVELLATICDELRINYNPQQQTLKHLVDALNRHLLISHASGRRIVVMIDEAQNLSLEVLEQIRLLTNLETSKAKLLQIILVGQPELREMLSRQELRQLNQRITARYHLLPLSLEETRTYIRHRLTVCGGDPELFKNAAIKKIYQVSKGIPRLINMVCHCALLGAYSAETRTITPAIINRAARETLAFAEPEHSYLKPLTIALAGVCALAAANYVLTNMNNSGNGLKFRTVLSGKFSVPRPNPTIDAFAAQQNVPPLLAKPQPPAKTFNDWLNNPQLTLPAALTEALELWGKPVNSARQRQVDCKLILKNGLNCLTDRARWQNLIALNRPAVLEFTTGSGVKSYVLLTGVKNGQPVFRFGQDRAFPLADVLSIWDGYYLLLWKSPNPGMTTILPGQSSNYVLWLRQQLYSMDNAQQDGNWTLYYDESLKKRVMAFQAAHQLNADGKVNAQTIIHLDNLTGAAGAPHLTAMN